MTLSRYLPRLRLGPATQLVAAIQPPLRAEVYGVERLEALARTLAETDAVAHERRPGRQLLDRFRSNGVALAEGQLQFAEAVQRGESLPPAAEWLLDNYYLVQGHLHQIEHDLSGTYYGELPKLAEGDYAGFPRIYALAATLVAHTDSRLDAAVVTRFIRAYQTVSDLTSGELWAVAIMLRMALVENLRRLVDHALGNHRRRLEATRLANRLLRLANDHPTRVAPAVAALAPDQGNLDASLVIHLVEGLRDQTPAVAPVVHWLEQWLSDSGMSLEAVTRAQHQRRAANRISIGNTIHSLRALQVIDWFTFFEASSNVEAALRQDPAGVYAEQDFSTRDAYRHAIEAFSRRSGRSETAVAERVVELAHRYRPGSDSAAEGVPAQDTRLESRGHVGFYLLSDGRAELAAALGLPRAPGRPAGRVHPLVGPLYMGGLALLALLLSLGLVQYSARAQPGLPPAAVAGLGLLVACRVNIATNSLPIQPAGGSVGPRERQERSHARPPAGTIATEAERCP